MNSAYIIELIGKNVKIVFLDGKQEKVIRGKLIDCTSPTGEGHIGIRTPDGRGFWLHTSRVLRLNEVREEVKQ
jgi:hypothetical protein